MKGKHPYLAARYVSGKGLQVLRAVSGAQRWRVKVQVTQDGQADTQVLDERVFSASARCDLRAMYELVDKNITEILPSGQLVRAAQMDFWVLPA